MRALAASAVERARAHAQRPRRRTTRLAASHCEALFLADHDLRDNVALLLALQVVWG
jgi:hypothetical protein